MALRTLPGWRSYLLIRYIRYYHAFIPILTLMLTSGFSRGAYLIRVLAGMIYKVFRPCHAGFLAISYLPVQVGLLNEGNNAQIPL
jgi:hypothetical protein